MSVGDGSRGQDSRLATVSERDTTDAPVPPPSGGGMPAGALASPRYGIESMLGTGATSFVFAARDRALDRPVALKVLAAGSGPAAARFIREARITAAIDHPNVVGVHDLEFVPGGTACIVMRRIEGRSLGQALRDGGLGDINRLVTIILKVCDAIARAHDRGVVHQDIKPDNIMLGAFGEVVVLDWGEARMLGDATPGGERRSVGTPAYMSPEQARGDPADQRSDVYCLAATAWHAVTGHHPVWDNDATRFWERKRAGVLDPLPPGTERGLPRRLLAILRKGLAADPAARYQRVADLAADLARFQAGLAVSAHRDGILERLAAWTRRHARALATTALVLAAFAGAALWVAAERRREQASWGEPILHEDFRDDSWQQRWMVPKRSQWQREDGRLVSTSPAEARLVLRQRLTGAVAIEYDACMLPGSHPGDLSAIWSERDPPRNGEAPDIDKGVRRRFVVQAGSYCNYFFCMFRHDGSDNRVAVVRERLSEGRWYHMRVELDGRIVRMLVDGREVMRHEDLLPIANGYIALYGYYPGKAFTNVRVWQKRLPERMPAIALGDEALRRGDPELAALQYQRCAESFPGTAMGDEAAFKRGLALDQCGRRAEARAAWAGVPAGPWRALVEEEALEDLWRAHDHAKAIAGMAALYRNDEGVRPRLRMRWMSWCAAYWSNPLRGDREQARALLDLKLAAFADDAATEEYACRLLLDLDGPEAVLARFPDEPFQAANALQELGRDAELLRRFPDLPDGTIDNSLLRLGRYDEVVARQRGAREVARALVLAGRADEARSHCPDDLAGWIHGGLWDEALARARDDGARLRVLLAAGRLPAAAGLLAEMPANDAQSERRLLAMLDGSLRPESDPAKERTAVLAWQVVRQLGEGRQAEAAAVRDQLATRRWRWSEPCEWTWRYLAPNLPALADGDPAPLRRALAELADQHRTEQAGRACSVAARALGRIDDAAVLAQPTRGEAQAWLAVATALHAELAGDRAAARAAWAGFLALPPQQRLLGRSLPDPVVEALARWRGAP